jgi:hypothetical protein
MISVKFQKSTRDDKRLMAKFYKDNKKFKTVHFGSGKLTGKGTYLEHKNNKIKNAWIARHKVNGTFENPFTASSLSYWILWNKKSLSKSIESYKKHFDFH